ncbi:hypothetical protein [Hymenobacter algoricola]|uniref:Uncharacterized protein n=1 Tax=Hymenobacter algoricola TaxID=486267 RepID=A0ABP7MG78_9BACT
MPKGNNFTAPITEADLTAARAAIKALQGKLAFVPQQPESLLTSATISPERLPLADLVLQAAEQAPDVLRKTTDAEQLRTKVASYRALVALRNHLGTELTRLDNALNVLGSDVFFQVNNIHEDIEKDKGETTDLGELRQQINAYYARPGARKGGGSKPA